MPEPSSSRARRAAPLMLWALPVAAFGLGLFARPPSRWSPAAGSIPGMTLDDASPRGAGLLVTSLRTGSEAQRDGIVAGDRVIAVDRHPVSSVREVGRLVGRAGRRGVQLEILHNRMRRDIVLQLPR